ncbi:MAG: PAS domain-containing protein, partial [Candidatus Omnitrophica bacterium]|nr:PAS domain-containing protein [Candidatus Omnitrophota bacterium]
ITDRSGKIIYVNNKFCQVSKYSQKELLGKDHRIINSGYHSKEFMRNLWVTIAQGKVWTGEICNRAKDGSFYWVDTTIVPFLNDKGRPYQYVAIRYDITRRKKMEDEIKQLPQQIIQAQETERAHISREIHDDLGQSLATLKMLIQSTFAEQNTQKKPAEKILQYLNVTIDKTRKLSSGLSPSTLDILGLTSSVKSLIKDFRQNSKLKILYSIGNLDNISFEGDIINFYRILQEALANIVKHSSADCVKIRVKKSNSKVVLTIGDNGKGFSVKSKKVRAKGLGISTMHQRAKLLGGDLEVSSAKNGGTLITLHIPAKEKVIDYVGV